MHRDRLRLSFRCGQSWEDMPGDERRRYCAKCDRHVHDLSARTWLGAAVRLAVARRSPCVRFASRSDGTVVFRPGLLSRLAAVVLALAPRAAAAGDAHLEVVSWIRARPDVRWPPEPETRTIEFGGLDESWRSFMPRDPRARRPRGLAMLHVAAPEGRWREVAVRCDGAPEPHRVPLADGRALVEDLPEGGSCELRLSGFARGLRVAFTAGYASAEVDLTTPPAPRPATPSPSPRAAGPRPRK